MIGFGSFAGRRQRLDRSRSSMRHVPLALAAVLPLAVGCASLAGGPRGFSLEETSHGLYERVDDRWVLVEQTAEVPCRLGQAYGLQAELVSIAEDGTQLPIQGEKFEVAEPGGKEMRILFLTDPMVAPAGEARRPIDAIWTVEPGPGGEAFEHPVLVRLFDPATYHVYLERTFVVKGCPD